MTIVFRTQVLDHTRTGNSHKNIRRRGTDWNSLRNYENDDTRDIAWNRSTHDTIYVKDRQNQGSIDIVGIFIGGPGDDFFLNDTFESKSFFLQCAKRTIQNSAEKSNYNYTSFSGDSLDGITKKLLKENRSNHLILIFRTTRGIEDCIENITKLASLNDILIIDIYHPFELNPSENILFEGKTIPLSSQRKYREQLEKNREHDIHMLKMAHISHIYLDTHENIENRLNYFFKERYHG